MRSINWDAIPCQSALGKRNVFTAQGKQQDFVLDTRCIEEMFSHADSRPSQHKNGFLQKSVRGRAPSLQVPQVVSSPTVTCVCVCVCMPVCVCVCAWLCVCVCVLRVVAVCAVK